MHVLLLSVEMLDGSMCDCYIRYYQYIHDYHLIHTIMGRTAYHDLWVNYYMQMLDCILLMVYGDKIADRQINEEREETEWKRDTNTREMIEYIHTEDNELSVIMIHVLFVCMLYVVPCVICPSA